MGTKASMLKTRCSSPLCTNADSTSLYGTLPNDRMHPEIDAVARSGCKGLSGSLGWLEDSERVKSSLLFLPCPYSTVLMTPVL